MIARTASYALLEGLSKSWFCSQSLIHLKWVEFGWGPHELEGLTVNKFYAMKFRQLSQEFRVRYTTLTEFLEIYGGQAKQRISWRRDDFHKLEPWGVGGDQLRREARETEAALAAAERFDAVASLLGCDGGRVAELEEAWKHLLISQSHGVSLCEDWADLTSRKPEEWLSDPAKRDESGHIVAAVVAFAARQLPSLGYATYYIEQAKSGVAPQGSDPKASE